MRAHVTIFPQALITLTMFHQASMYEREVPAAQLTPIARTLQVSLFGLLACGIAYADESTGAKPDSAEATLPVVSVKARAQQETPTSPVSGYIARRSATATKTDTPIIETPQSISIVGAEEIEVRKAKSLIETLAYVPGVVSNTNPGDRTGEFFSFRGFYTESLFRDGNRYFTAGLDGRPEPYGLERVEMLRGPASVMYGTATPGGLINVVSKRPSSDPLHEINLELGSFNRKQISGDFGGTLTEDGTLTWRLTGLKRDSDTFVDYGKDDRTYIAPALKWQPSTDTSLTLLSEYQHDRSIYVGDLPAEGTELQNPNGRLARSRFGGIPGHDQYNNKKWSVGYVFEHAINDQLLLRNNLRYLKSWRTYNYTFGGTLSTDDWRTLSDRTSADAKQANSLLVSDLSLQYKWATAGVSHTTLAGLDYSKARQHEKRLGRTTTSMDLYAPDYGAAYGDPTSINNRHDVTNQTGVYLQDQMKFGEHWALTLGGRHSRVRVNNATHTTNEAGESDTATKQNPSATTGQAGLVYLADNGLAPYISFSQSFEPEIGSDRQGKAFKPTTGEQWELGVRYQPKNSQTSISAAVYDLTKTNVTVTDPIDTTYSMQQGKVRSRGLELEIRTSIGRNGNLVAAYAYTDARTIKSSLSTPEEEGKRTVSIPYHQFSLWSDYGLGAFGLPGWTVGGGVRYVGSSASYTTALNNTSPSYTVLDAMVSYAIGPWRLALNVTNLTDKTYVMCPYGGCSYGEPRNVVGTLSYRW